MRRRTQWMIEQPQAQSARREDERRNDGRRGHVRGAIAPAAHARTVAAGLVKHYGQEELAGRNVLVLSNLKPVDVRGVLELRLEVTDAGDGITCDAANWANARLIR